MSLAFAKKIGMTRLFVGEVAKPVTVIQIKPTYVLQIKTTKNDGYEAVQMGSVLKSIRKSRKPLVGITQKYTDITDSREFQLVEEFKRVDLIGDKKKIDIADFSETDLLDITGTTIGRGFTGPIKRWGFKGQPASHGHDVIRKHGSIGTRWPQRVPKGKKMAGHYGNEVLTLKKVKILAIDSEFGLIFVNGSLPGANGGYLKIQKAN